MAKSPDHYSLDDYQKLLWEGLLDGETMLDGSQTKVAIVGAGMAGLVAAWLLRRAGACVRVYEASNRVGGRVKTLREDFTHGLFAEAGAMRIPEQHLLTRGLCCRLGLALDEFTEEADNALIRVNGQTASMSEYRSGNTDFGSPYQSGRVMPISILSTSEGTGDDEMGWPCYR